MVCEAVRCLPICVFLIAACDSGAKQEQPRLPTSKGSLLFDMRPANDAELFLRTEAEVMRSAQLLEHVRDLRRGGVELTPEAITVTPRRGAMILDVAVSASDPRVAAELCNALIAGYIDQRRMRARNGIDDKLQVIAAAYDAAPADSPDRATLKAQLDELRLSHPLQRSDVRALDRCKVPPAAR